MGSLHEAEKHAKAAIKKFGAQLATALEPEWRLLREAARVKDTAVPTLTMYVHEDIGIGKDLENEMGAVDARWSQITGVYIPPSVKPGASVNVILFMHGDKVRKWDEHGTIRDYWNSPFFPLRQGLSASGKPFILVAPTLGASVGYRAEFGNLGTQIDDHLEHVMSELQRLGPPQFAPSKPPVIDQLIIAGHSGAYGPLQSILSDKGIKKYRSKIKEIWCFDTNYINLSVEFAKLGKTVYSYFVDGSNGTEGISRRLAKLKLPNVFVMRNVDFDIVKGKVKERDIGHDLLMQRFWQDRCQRIGTNGSDPDDKKRMI